MCLEKFANGKHSAWPSHATIAKECSISKAQVKRTIRSLIDKGLLERIIRKESNNACKSNMYILYHPKRRNKNQAEMTV